MVTHILTPTVSEDTLPEFRPLATDIARVLGDHYPGHPWYVRVIPGVAVIHNYGLSKTSGFVLHLDRIPGGMVTRGAVLAGGEFLERHGIPRGGFRLEDYPRVVRE